MQKKGFSLVEMMVVMAIMAVMASLGVTALINSRKNAEVDKVTEEILSMVRQAQNNSIAVKQDKLSHQTKVWAVNIRSYNAISSQNTYKLLSWYPSAVDSTKLDSYEEDTMSAPSSVKITVPGAGSTNAAYVAFAVPFGSGTVLMNDTCLRTSLKCYWTESLKPTKEWFLNTGATWPDNAEKNNVYNVNNNAGSQMTIKIESTSSGYSRNVIIKATGDAYSE